MKSLQLPPCRVSGEADITIIRKGKVIHEFKRVKNLIMNQGLAGTGGAGLNLLVQTTTFIGAGTSTQTHLNYVDLDGTWQVAAGTNVLSRVSGTGTLTTGSAYPGCVGCEIKFADGTRAHIITFTSSTQAVLSRTFTSGVAAQALRQYYTNQVYNAGNYTQTVNTPTSSGSTDLSAGTKSRQLVFQFGSAVSGYSFASLNIYNNSSGLLYTRIVLPSAVVLETDDQVNVTYTLYATVGSRDISFDLSNITGLPFPYSVSSITGNGTSFDIVTTAAHHFLTGDQIVLPAGTTVPKRFNISSGSSTSSDITVNTATAHGLSVGNSVTIENASVSGYNGTWTVDTVPDSDTFTIASALNPGALGASGTVRLATPGTYFNGTWTVASIPNSTTIRVTSAVTGPAVDTSTIVRSISTAKLNIWMDGFGGDTLSNFFFFNETNKKSIPAVTSTSAISTTGSTASSVTQNNVSAAYTNDWLRSQEGVWNAGIADQRVSQIYVQGSWHHLITFDCPQPKPTTHKLVIKFQQKLVRDLP